MTASVPQLRSSETAATCIGDYLAAQRGELRTNGPRVRRREPESVHDLRVASRRFRSVLATFGPMLVPSATERLRTDLRWLAGELAGARDTEVVHERMIAMMVQEPRDPTLSTVRRRIDADLLDALDAAHVRALEALDSSRYVDLLERLDALVDETPWAEPAHRPAAEALAPRILGEWKRLRRNVTAAAQSSNEAERGALLHEVRKSAKRTRYAAEVAQPVFGGPAAEFGESMAHLQTVLGDRQDSVVTLEGIRSLADSAHAVGESAFVYGRLHAREQARAACAEADYTLAWERAAAKGLRRWLKP